VCACVRTYIHLHTFIQTCNVFLILSRDADSLEDVQMLNSGHSFGKNGSVHRIGLGNFSHLSDIFFQTFQTVKDGIL